MPIYAYKCDSCGHAKDVLQKMSDALLTDCPACGASTFKKQLTAAGFQLKGSGWYVTDFKGGAAGAAPGEKSDAASEPVSAGKADAGADSNASTPKADSKVETKSVPGAQEKAVAKPATPAPAKPSTSATPAASN